MLPCYAIPAVQWGECSNSAVWRMRKHVRRTFCAFLSPPITTAACMQSGDVTWNRL